MFTLPRAALLAITVASAAALPVTAQFAPAEHLGPRRRLPDQRGRPGAIEGDGDRQLSHDVYGPRLTGSPELKEAADWAQKTMTSLGPVERPHGAVAVRPRLGNERMWRWHFAARVSAHRLSEGVDARHQRRRHRRGEIAVINEEKDFDALRGKLRGKFVLRAADARRHGALHAGGRRYTETELAELSKQPAPARPRPWARGNARRRRTSTRRSGSSSSTRASSPCSTSAAATAARSSCRAAAPRDPQAAPVAPQVTLEVEHYGRIYRHPREENPRHAADGHRQPLLRRRPERLQHRRARFPARDKAGRGRDARRALRLVARRHRRDRQRRRLGGDDGGDAHPQGHRRQPRRTVRIALWTGEEQGLLGSRPT